MQESYASVHDAQYNLVSSAATRHAPSVSIKRARRAITKENDTMEHFRKSLMQNLLTNEPILFFPVT
jgi:hypothetical protein